MHETLLYAFFQNIKIAAGQLQILVLLLNQLYYYGCLYYVNTTCTEYSETASLVLFG